MSTCTTLGNKGTMMTSLPRQQLLDSVYFRFTPLTILHYSKPHNLCSSPLSTTSTDIITSTVKSTFWDRSTWSGNGRKMNTRRWTDLGSVVYGYITSFVRTYTVWQPCCVGRLNDEMNYWNHIVLRRWLNSSSFTSRLTGNPCWRAGTLASTIPRNNFQAPSRIFSKSQSYRTTSSKMLHVFFVSSHFPCNNPLWFNLTNARTAWVVGENVTGTVADGLTNHWSCFLYFTCVSNVAWDRFTLSIESALSYCI
jgi:hypothetical protein